MHGLANGGHVLANWESQWNKCKFSVNHYGWTEKFHPKLGNSLTNLSSLKVHHDVQVKASDKR